jgi:23S rRNA (pseudouridine1915-N3)-methyltransferase
VGRRPAARARGGLTGPSRAVRLLVVAVGRLKEGPERTLAERYRERARALGRGLGIGPLDSVEVPESRARRAEDRRREEGALLRQRAAGAALILFDERGRSPTSEAFAARLGGLRDAATPSLACLIGGADGLDESLRAEAREIVAFGALTLPHQLVRVLVFEQLYRALTLLAGHPYHRGGEEP